MLFVVDSAACENYEMSWPLHLMLFCTVTGKRDEIWIIEDFVIDGNNVHNPTILMDTFDYGPKEDNWFFYPGGNIGLYCPYSSKGAP